MADVHVEMVADRQKHGLDTGGKIKGWKRLSYLILVTVTAETL